MRVSLKWLKEYLDFDLKVEEVCDLLTSTGLEVEEVLALYPVDKWSELIKTARILKVEKHPQADRLTVCRVTDGDNEYQVICGAPNVAEGQIVPLALAGAILENFHGEKLKLKKTKIRGVESEGMICAEDELGISQNHEGIMVFPGDTPIGITLKDYFANLNDYVIDIAITPNRGDANSVLGVARDLAARLNVKIKYPEIPSLSYSDKFTFQVKIERPDLCPRYSGIIVDGVKVAESPGWLKHKIRLLGMNPVNNIVDIANYLMYENGQPLHAFDYEKLEGGNIVVKTLPAGTPFETLDGSSVKLNGEELMICDEKKGVAMGGIMGGMNSMVTENTRTILIESAYFNPSSIRKSARYHGFSTDASYRFERGTNPEFTVNALKRAAALICDVCGGEVASSIVDAYPEPIPRKSIELNSSFVNQLSGLNLSSDEMACILERLEYVIVERKGDQLLVEVPGYRTDIERPVDLVEEILRIYSYEKVPVPEKLITSLPSEPHSPIYDFESKIRWALVNLGFFEIMTPSFVNSELIHDLHSNKKTIKALNAVNRNLDTLRTELFVSGLDVLSFNLRRQQKNLKLFELAKIYFQEQNQYIEEFKLGLWTCGYREEQSWDRPLQKVDFYYLKSVIQHLALLASIPVKNLKQTEFHDKRFDYALTYSLKNEKPLAIIGRIHSSWLKKLDIDREVFYAEIDWKSWYELWHKTSRNYALPSRFPLVWRDVAFSLDKNIRYEDLKNEILKLNMKELQDFRLFDVYEGKNIEKGKKSYALRFRFHHPEKTLTDKEVDSAMNKIVNLIKEKFNAHIRGESN